jgi:hypothetical protein
MRGVWWLFGVWCLVFGVCGCLCGVAFGLSGGRVFEQVSPVYKGGFGATHIESVGLGGGGVAFYSPGAFGGAPAGLSPNLDSLDYLASRGGSGWVTVPIAPPDALMPDVTGRDISGSLGVTLAMGKQGSGGESAFQEATEEEFLLHDTGLPDVSGAWELAGMRVKPVREEPVTLEYLDASADFCHLLFESRPVSPRPNSGVLLAKADGAQPQVYELTRGCGGEPVVLRLVGVNAKGDVISPSCSMELGVEEYASKNEFNAVSADGGTLFFTTCIEGGSGHQVFARLGGSSTIEVSKSLTDKCGVNEIPCKGAAERASANFVGASEDGSRVFFISGAQLTGEDSNVGASLYMAELGCPGGGACGVSERRVTSIVELSPDAGGDADVLGVVRVAPDGSRVYFAAAGDLLSAGEQSALEKAGSSVPRVGAANLYVYDAALGGVRFIADLCSGYSLSGSVEDAHCPNRTQNDERLWLGLSGGSEAQTGGVDGRFLVFESYGQLTSDDTDSARDVYRFDAVTGSLERVSGGENGYHNNGNDDEFDASIELGNLGGPLRSQDDSNARAISEDGSRIVFTSVEPLSPLAINGLPNVYEWHEDAGGGGSVSLLSGGSATTPVEDVVMDPSGENVFFITTQGLVPQDTDGAPDLYDARVDGGFPPVATSRVPCESEACQGPLTNPAPLLVPGSVSQTPGENVAAPSRPAVSKAKKKKTKTKAPAKTKKKSRARGKQAGRRKAKDDAMRAGQSMRRGGGS